MHAYIFKYIYIYISIFTFTYIHTFVHSPWDSLCGMGIPTNLSNWLVAQRSSVDSTSWKEVVETTKISGLKTLSSMIGGNHTLSALYKVFQGAEGRMTNETSSSPKPPHVTSRSHQGEDCCQCILGVGKTEDFFLGGKNEGFSHQKTPESVESLSVRFLSKETLDSTCLKLAQVLLYWLITSQSNMYNFCIIYVLGLLHIMSTLFTFIFGQIIATSQRSLTSKGSWNLFYCALKTRLMKFILIWPYMSIYIHTYNYISYIYGII